MASGKANQVTFAAGEPEFRAARLRSAKACSLYNQQPEDASVDKRTALWWNIVTTDPPEVHHSPPNPDSQSPSSNTPFANGAPYVKPPINIDYGTNLHIGAGTFINRGCKILDTPVQPVRIGERCLIGPDFHIYAVGHPLDHRQRSGVGAPSLAMEVEVGNDCWIGGRVSVLAGVKIGSRCVIGCSSVVTKDIPPGHLAVGNPARIVRKIDDEEPATTLPPHEQKREQHFTAQEKSTTTSEIKSMHTLNRTDTDWLDEHHQMIEAALLLAISFLAKGIVVILTVAALWRLVGFFLRRGGRSSRFVPAPGFEAGIMQLELRLYAFAVRLVEWMASWGMRRPGR